MVITLFIFRQFNTAFLQVFEIFRLLRNLPIFLINQIPSGRGNNTMISQICNQSLARTCPHSKARKHWSLRFFGFSVSVTGVASLLRGCLRLTTPGRLSGRDSGTFGVAAVMSDLDFVGVPTEINEPHRDKTNKMACAPSEDSDQPGHLPSLIRVFAVCMKKGWVLSYPLSAQKSS